MGAQGRTHQRIHASSISLRTVELGAGNGTESRLGLEQHPQGCSDLLDLLGISDLATLRALDEETIAEANVIAGDLRLAHIQGEIAQDRRDGVEDARNPSIME